MDHLPQGTIILFIELDMTDIVSEETISQYETKIQYWVKQREERKAEEAQYN